MKKRSRYPRSVASIKYSKRNSPKGIAKQLEKEKLANAQKLAAKKRVSDYNKFVENERQRKAT